MKTRAAASGKAKTARAKGHEFSAAKPVRNKAAIPAASSGAIKPAVVSEITAVVSSPELKKRELIDRVVERSDIKTKFAKPVIEAALAVLGEALAEGRELNLQPMGKLKYNRTKETENARIIVAKIRQVKTFGPSVAGVKSAVSGRPDD
ncbi:Bacterial DNA-binding protein [Roseovarius litorisediminis]|uniref:Bacterial DNA-binding protein n=1 Tax=Roseovarius litorisediminis TaxID=1312363 RepID=A0A1Y5TDN7_9RHOB|nr:HU family DNA-binding protein [Roseovarius litorisediminis]SLN61433.1 Bacterial DNA-binding protein [Roseovarius litorisediminis]